MKQSTMCVFSLLGGMVIGSAVALAFAPKTGKEMRGMVRNFLNDEYEKWCGHKDATPACECEQK